MKPQKKENYHSPKRSLEEFKSFCRQNLMADLREIEITRKKVLRSIEIVTLVSVIAIGLAVRFMLTVPSSQTILVSLSIVGITPLLWVAFYTSATETYGQGFQRNVIEKIVRFLDPERNLTYSRTGDPAVVLSALQKSQLFKGTNQSLRLKQDRRTVEAIGGLDVFPIPQITKSIDGIKQVIDLQQDHCINGKIGETNVFFSELNVQREASHIWTSNIFELIYDFSRYGGSGVAITALVLLLAFVSRGLPYCLYRIAAGQRINFEHFRNEIILNTASYEQIFKGIFFISDFSKTFRGKTVILPNKLRSKVKFLNQHRGQSVKLEDPEFNKFFSVYSNDQIGARYVLSTSVMQRIVDFRKKANRDLFIALVDSQLYIAVPSEEDLFEPRLFKTMLSFNPMREYFEILQLMMSIVEDLNLNQRIWKI